MRFREAVMHDAVQKKSIVEYDIDRYDECFLRHLALGYTKDMIASLKTMPFGVKSLEKRQADLISRLFPENEQRGINVTRLVVRAIELKIIDIENLDTSFPAISFLWHCPCSCLLSTLRSPLTPVVLPAVL